MIGDVTRSKIVEQIDALIETYLPQIDQAYMKQENSLTVSFSTKISPIDVDEMKIETSISFVADRVKDRTEGTANERQAQLFGAVDSVTFKHGDKEVTLGKQAEA